MKNDTVADDLTTNTCREASHPDRLSVCDLFFRLMNILFMDCTPVVMKCDVTFGSGGIPFSRLCLLYCRAGWGDHKGTNATKSDNRLPEIITVQFPESLAAQGISGNYHKL